MGFLAKFAGIVLKGVAIAAGLGGIVSQQFPGASGAVTRISDFLAELAPIIVTVEAIGQVHSIPGAEKARAAGPLIGQLIMASSIMTGKKIERPDLFKQGCVNIAGGVADVLNSLNAEGAKEVAKT